MSTRYLQITVEVLHWEKQRSLQIAVQYQRPSTWAWMLAHEIPTLGAWANMHGFHWGWEKVHRRCMECVTQHVCVGEVNEAKYQAAHAVRWNYFLRAPRKPCPGNFDRSSTWTSKSENSVFKIEVFYNEWFSNAKHYHIWQLKFLHDRIQDISLLDDSSQYTHTTRSSLRALVKRQTI